MKKYIRVIALLLALVMIAALAVSCKKAPDEDDEEVITDTDDGSNASNTEYGDGDDNVGDVDEGGNEGGTTKKTGKSGSSNKDKKGSGDTAKDDKKDDAALDGGSKEADKSKGEGGTATGEVTEKGGWKEDEEGKVIETKTSVEFDEETMTYKTAITNQNDWVPDEEQGLEKSARRATEESKYDFDRNPLINRDRHANKTYMPSFNMDDTGFVRAGTKIADLKGKTLFFFTGGSYSAWSYRNEKGETIGELDWFKQLKAEIGLNIKYSLSSHVQSPASALQYMNAGKQLDIVYSSHVAHPSALCISRSITDKVNINNLGSSPGVCKRTMDIAKWGNTLRIISPIGCVDVLWYNQTLAQQLNLSDPHLMWEKGKWNWDTFKNFMMSAPKTTQDGTKLIALTQWPANTAYCWPSTNGAPRIYIDADADMPTLINNWDNPLCIEALEFICTIMNSIQYPRGEGEAGAAHKALWEGTTLMSAAMNTQVYHDTEYSKNVQINWVPYPKSTNPEGQEIAEYYGWSMMLPKKTAKEDNVDYALKFMELWATRFTEALFDNLNTFEYYNFNYKQRKQYFDFVTNNVVFALAMNDLRGCDGDIGEYFRCFIGDASYNVKTVVAKLSNPIQKYVVESLKYGQ